MKSKGMSTTTIQIFTALLTLGLIAVFWFMLIAYYFDVEDAVTKSEVERHNLNLAQVLISSPRLTYSDGNQNYRGILDWSKVDKQLVSGSELLNEIGYPNSIMAIGVKNLDTGKTKSVAYFGSFSLTGLNIVDFWGCLKPKISLDMIFRIPPLPPWYLSDIVACAATEASKYGTEVRSFPISVIEGGEVHPGILFVTIMEFW